MKEEGEGPHKRLDRRSAGLACSTNRRGRERAAAAAGRWSER